MTKDQRLYRHFTNGTKNIFCLPDNCPEGYYPGITPIKQRRKKPNNFGKKHFTNGQKNIFCFERDCPEGFYPGTTKRYEGKRVVTKSKSLALFDQIKNDKELLNKFKQLYLTASLSDCAREFNTTGAIVDKIGSKYLNLVRDEATLKSVMQQRQLKIKNTCLQKYGTATPAQSEIVQQKTRERMLDKYGIDKCGRAIYALNSNYSDIFKQLLFDRDASIEFLKKRNREITRHDLALEFNCPDAALLNWIYKFNLEEYFKFAPSHFEDDIVQYIESIGVSNIKRHNRDILDGREIDIYLPDVMIGIEFNGTYWHSNANVSKHYHEDKSKLANDKHIRLIHIYEFEWNDPIQQIKIKQLLNIAIGKVQNRIYARKCTIKQISNKEAKLFNDENHLQCHRNAQITYGLYYNDQLVQLMSFSKTRYNKNLKNDNEWEIIRGCPGSNNIVVGGVSKLFKHFIDDVKPNKVFSYCDFNKFDGRGYEAIGMACVGYTGPNKWWILKNGTVVNRNPSKYKYYKDNAVGIIWGSGSKKYIWSKEDK